MTENSNFNVSKLRHLAPMDTHTLRHYPGAIFAMRVQRGVASNDTHNRMGEDLYEREKRRDVEDNSFDRWKSPAGKMGLLENDGERLRKEKRKERGGESEIHLSVEGRNRRDREESKGIATNEIINYLKRNLKKKNGEVNQLRQQVLQEQMANLLNQFHQQENSWNSRKKEKKASHGKEKKKLFLQPAAVFFNDLMCEETAIENANIRANETVREHTYNMVNETANKPFNYSKKKANETGNSSYSVVMDSKGNSLVGLTNLNALTQHTANEVNGTSTANITNPYANNRNVVANVANRGSNNIDDVARGTNAFAKDANNNERNNHQGKIVSFVKKTEQKPLMKSEWEEHLDTLQYKYQYMDGRFLSDKLKKIILPQEDTQEDEGEKGEVREHERGEEKERHRIEERGEEHQAEKEEKRDQKGGRQEGEGVVKVDTALEKVDFNWREEQLLNEKETKPEMPPLLDKETGAKKKEKSTTVKSGDLGRREGKMNGEEKRRGRGEESKTKDEWKDVGKKGEEGEVDQREKWKDLDKKVLEGEKRKESRLIKRKKGKKSVQFKLKNDILMKKLSPLLSLIPSSLSLFGASTASSPSAASPITISPLSPVSPISSVFPISPISSLLPHSSPSTVSISSRVQLKKRRVDTPQPALLSSKGSSLSLFLPSDITRRGSSREERREEAKSEEQRIGEQSRGEQKGGEERRGEEKIEEKRRREDRRKEEKGNNLNRQKETEWKLQSVRSSELQKNDSIHSTVNVDETITKGSILFPAFQRPTHAQYFSSTPIYGSLPSPSSTLSPTTLHSKSPNQIPNLVEECLQEIKKILLEHP